MPDLVDDATAANAETILALLPPERLRPILSRLAAKTPDVVYYGATFAADCKNLPERTIGQVGMTPLGQALTMVAASATLVEGDSMTVRVSGLTHGDRALGDYEVVCTRLPKK